MITKDIELRSFQDTEKLGVFLGKAARPGDVICLDGDLGAGKTALTQAIAKGLEVPQSYYVTSPSFAIFHEYPGRLPLYHMDFYRLSDESEIIDMGLDEYFYLQGVTVIEWSKRAGGLLPEEKLSLNFTLTGDETRLINLKVSRAWRARIEALSDIVG